MIFVFKVIMAPIIIFCLTLLSRRFGSAVGGLLMGVPLVTGPISVFTTLDNGAAFARHAAIGNIVGQISTCVFCFAYAITARRHDCWLSATVSVAAFFIATAIWNAFSWSLLPALGLLLATIIGLSLHMKAVKVDAIAWLIPRWDLPARMIISACFVVGITWSTRRLGPQLSGLIAPFPTFVLILAMFTHHQLGAPAAANLVRGVILGSSSFAAFFTVVELLLPGHSVAVTYSAAVMASTVASGTTYLASWSLRRHRPS